MNERRLTGRAMNQERSLKIPEYKTTPSGKVLKLIRENGQPIIDSMNPSQYAYELASAQEAQRFLQTEAGAMEVESHEDDYSIEDLLQAQEEARLLAESIAAEIERKKEERALAEVRAAQEAEAAEALRRQEAFAAFVAKRNGYTPQGVSNGVLSAEFVATEDEESAVDRLSLLHTKRGKVLAGSVLLATLGTASWVGLDRADVNPFTSANAMADTSMSEFDKSAAISAAAFDVDTCFDEAGAGTPLFSGDIAAMDWVNWPIARTDKSVTEVLMKNDNPEYAPIGKEDAATRKPFVTFETAVDYAACVPEAEADAFLAVDGTTVTVDLSVATPQFALRQEGIRYGVEQFELDERKNDAGDIIVTKEVAAATVAASQDKAVTASLLDMAKAKAAGVLTKADGEYTEQMQAVTDAYKSEITEEITQQAAAFYEQIGQPAGKLEIKIEGELKTTVLEYKGAAPKASDKVALADEAMKITQFNPIAE